MTLDSVITNAYRHHFMGYTKLFYDIILSTVWREKDTTRLVWITMLALRNKHHVVEASVPGLADAARVSVEACRIALKVLSDPDPDSRSKELEGRRIQEVEGGWWIINGEKYRRKMSEEERREKNAIYQKTYRERKKKVSTDIDISAVSAQEEKEYRERGTEKEYPPNPPKGGKPTHEMVVDFFKNKAEAEKFWDHYQSNGWKVGRNPLKDWEAAARNWQRNTKNYSNPIVRATPQEIEQRRLEASSERLRRAREKLDEQ